MFSKKILPLLLTCALMAVLLCVSPAFAAGKITSTVDIDAANKNQTGEGYYWHNPSSTLTLTDLVIETTDDYGLRLAANSTVILNGDNYIKASKAALYCAGTVAIKGSGSLTLVSDSGMGIYVNTAYNTDRISFIKVKTTITAGGDGIHSYLADVNFAGGTLTIHTTGAYAVNNRVFTVSDGATVTADNTISATGKLSFTASDISVTSPDKAALIYGPKFNLTDLDVTADQYTGANTFTAKSTYVKKSVSVLFGENHTAALDVVVLIVMIAAIAAVIALPIIHHHKKNLEGEARYAAARRERRKPASKKNTVR